jgi:3-oxoacyl-[acyl-carrier-protein] synthase II
VPGEGSVFFVVGGGPAPGPYGRIESVSVGVARGAVARADVCLVDADGLLPDESSYRQALPAGTPVASYTPVFGSVMSGSAFHAAAGALMLRDQVRYACPVADNPRGIALCTETGPAPTGSVACVRHNCSGEQGLIRLARQAGRG